MYHNILLYIILYSQMVEYIMNGQLSIEVWGSQKEVAQAKPATGKAGDKKAPAGKSTKELMAAEKAKVGSFTRPASVEGTDYTYRSTTHISIVFVSDYYKHSSKKL